MFLLIYQCPLHVPFQMFLLLLPRIVLDNNIADQFIALSEDVTPSLPEPLRSPPYTTPRPVFPDIPIPPPGNDIELDIRQQLLETPDTFDLPQTSSDYPTLPSAFEALIKVGQELKLARKQIIISRKFQTC